MFTIHTGYVLHWINQIIAHPEPLTARQTEFLDELKANIENGTFCVSLHPMGREDLLIETIEPWLYHWESLNEWDKEPYDPQLERLIKDFRVKDEFSFFDRFPLRGTCTRCGQEGRDVNRDFNAEEGEGEKGICHYGCDDLRSQLPEDEPIAEKGDDAWKWGIFRFLKGGEDNV